MTDTAALFQNHTMLRFKPDFGILPLEARLDCKKHLIPEIIGISEFPA